MVLEFGASLGSALAAIIIGIILIIIAQRIQIENIVNTLLYIVGAIILVVGIILLALYFIGYIV